MALLLKLLIAVTLLVAALGLPVPEEEEAVVEERDDSYRLPKTAIPSNYKIKISVTFDETLNHPFEGSVDITVTPEPDATEIVLHYSPDMTITETKFVFKNQTEVELDNVSDEKLNFLKLRQLDNSTFPAEESILKISYNSHLAKDMAGLYLSTYEQDGETQYLASTQFESTDARRAFPCFDEPHLKATFDLTLEFPVNYTAIANTEESKSTVSENTKTVTFDPTPLMSTYLLAFVISKFEYAEAKDGNDRKHRVYYQPNFAGQADVALQASIELLTQMENYTNIPFEIPKIDQVAIPDFAAGAMENWGLVTYRERALLINESESTTKSLQSVITIIAHEYAHQWFGDLVSPLWWDVTWLNEGFATYFEHHAVAAVEKYGEWRMLEQFVVDTVQPALSYDASSKTHPMTNDVWTPNEISAIFDTVSYEKAGSVIRMTEHALGSGNFKKGLQEYLNKKRTGAATETDLFEALQSAVGDNFEYNVADFLQSWTTTAGYPVISITVTGNNVSFQQERFLLNSTAAREDSVWIVPITFQISNNNTVEHIWLDSEEDNHTLSEDIGDNYLLANIEARGFYRVKYDTGNWNKIIKALTNENDITHVNKAQLLDDAFNLALAEYMDYDSVLDLTLYLKEETDYIPWNTAFKALSYFNYRLRDDNDAIAAFRKYVRKLLEKVYLQNKFDQEKTDHVDKLNQMQILTWACEVRNDDCLNRATNLLETSFGSITANFKNVVYCYGLKSQNKDNNNRNWRRLMETYNSTSTPTEKVLILSSLGCIEDVDILGEYLNKTLGDTEIRAQDYATVFSSVAENVAGFSKALNFFMDNYNQSPKWKESLRNIIRALLPKINNKEDLEKVTKWATDLDFGNAQATFNQAVVDAQQQIDWVSKHKEHIVAWLNEHNNATGNKASFLLYIFIAAFSFIKILF